MVLVLVEVVKGEKKVIKMCIRKVKGKLYES